MGSSPFQAPLVGSFGPFHSWYPDQSGALRDIETRARLLSLWRVGVYPGSGTYGCSKGKLDLPLPCLPSVALNPPSYDLVLYF